MTQSACGTTPCRRNDAAAEAAACAVGSGAVLGEEMEDLVDDECALVQFDDDPATNGSNV